MNKQSAIRILLYFIVIVMFLGIVKWMDHGVTAAVQTKPILRKAVFVIDAGHGGVDGGATSCTGILESQINLEIALRLNELMHLLGFETVMVRTQDISVYTEGNSISQKKVSDLKERVRIVKDTPNSVLISIHQNTFPDGRYTGAQVFYSNNEISKSFAQMVQENMITAVNPGSKRACKQAKGVYLMDHIESPGILVECGFLSNPEEEHKLCEPDYQKKLCCVIAASVSQLFA